MIHYHKGDVIKNRSKIEIKLTKSKYDAFNKKRNYANFKLGTTIFLDVTNFKTAECESTIKKVKQLIGGL